MAAAHTVLLVEDERNTCERLAEAIAAHESLVLLAAAASCAEALRALDGAAPDVLLTDLGLPDGSGVDLIREVRRRGLATECMVITVFGDEKHVVSAIEAGALGYLLKDGSAECIARSILDLVAGGSPISPQIARYFLKHFRADAAGVDDAARPRLTEREHGVLRLIVKGFSYAEAARLTGVAESTITSPVRNIYCKLEVHSRGEAVYEALQLGLVKLEQAPCARPAAPPRAWLTAARRPRATAAPSCDPEPSRA